MPSFTAADICGHLEPRNMIYRSFSTRRLFRCLIAVSIAFFVGGAVPEELRAQQEPSFGQAAMAATVTERKIDFKKLAAYEAAHPELFMDCPTCPKKEADYKGLNALGVPPQPFPAGANIKMSASLPNSPRRPKRHGRRARSPKPECHSAADRVSIPK